MKQRIYRYSSIVLLLLIGSHIKTNDEDLRSFTLFLAQNNISNKTTYRTDNPAIVSFLDQTYYFMGLQDPFTENQNYICVKGYNKNCPSSVISEKNIICSSIKTKNKDIVRFVMAKALDDLKKEKISTHTLLSLLAFENRTDRLLFQGSNDESCYIAVSYLYVLFALPCSRRSDFEQKQHIFATICDSYLQAEFFYKANKELLKKANTQVATTNREAQKLDAEKFTYAKQIKESAAKINLITRALQTLINTCYEKDLYITFRNFLNRLIAEHEQKKEFERMIIDIEKNWLLSNNSAKKNAHI